MSKLIITKSTGLKISNSNPGSPLAARYGTHTKTTKEIKTREVLKKHKVI